MKSVSLIILTCALAVVVARPAAALDPSAAQGEVLPAATSLQEGAQEGSAASTLSGNWQLSFAGRKGNRQISMQIKQDGNKLSGSFQGERGSAPLTGKLDGNQVSFTVKMPRRQVSFNGTVDGNKMTGSTEQGGSWSANRQ